MKVLTKEEEQAHYSAVVQGGSIGTAIGLAFGGAGVFLAQRRFPMFRATTLPLKAFLVTSSATLVGIISADRASRAFDTRTNAQKRWLIDEEEREEAEFRATHTRGERIKEWFEHNRYPIVFGSWVASMGLALGIVSRNRYLTPQQKLVQARVYAQGLTVAVLIASFGLEANDATKGKGRWETIKVLDPNDPTHKHLIEKRIHHERYSGEDQWMEMVAAEERKLKEREAARRAAAEKVPAKQ